MNGINMNTARIMPMKGLLKGLRYISQIFDNEKEEEIQIGLPTDVKHVAHIGMDGPSASAPSWMNKNNPNSETTRVSPKGESKQNPSTNSLYEENVARLSQKSSSGQLDSPTKRSSRKTRHTRHSSRSSTGSADGDSFNLCKPRRHKHSGEIGSPTSEHTRRHKHSGEIDSLKSEKVRRHKHSGDIGSSTSERDRGMHNQNIGSDSLSENQPKIPKSRRKKSGGSSGSGSLRSSRSKSPDPFRESSPYSDLDPNPGFEKNEVRSNTVYDEVSESEQISRGNLAL